MMDMMDGQLPIPGIDDPLDGWEDLPDGFDDIYGDPWEDPREDNILAWQWEQDDE